MSFIFLYELGQYKGAQSKRKRNNIQQMIHYCNIRKEQKRKKTKNEISLKTKGCKK